MHKSADHSLCGQYQLPLSATQHAQQQGETRCVSCGFRLSRRYGILPAVSAMKRNLAFPRLLLLPPLLLLLAGCAARNQTGGISE